jgi:tetratricopeptide (TPR) repeat protein
MASRALRRYLLVLLLIPFVSVPLAAQSRADASDQAKRQRAIALFHEGKRLEALPLLEELAEKDPRDGEVLVALAACLVGHGATLTDADAAAKERFRAKDLVRKAWGLGYASPLEENLRQLLGELPASGAIKFSDNPEVQKAMLAGEAAFSRRDFEEALKEYGKALELEPANYAAVLFTGNTYDKKNDLAKAAEWYERATKVDPNTETAYRYYADMAARQGDMAKARQLLIEAAVAEPYNKIVWREIRAWAVVNHTAFNLVYVLIPAPTRNDPALTPGLSAEVSSAWGEYYAVKSEWENGGKFQKQFPQEREFRHSLPEEMEALTAAAMMLEKLKDDPKTKDHVIGDPPAELLLKLHEAGLIDAYVLFSLGDEGIAKDYAAYRLKHRDKLEIYMDRFVVPPAQARQSSAP